MSQNSPKKTKEKVIDTRSFVEIWYSLPEVGQSMLLNALMKRGLSRGSIYSWISDGRKAKAENIHKIELCLKSLYSIRTSPITLFPGSENNRKELIRRMRRMRDEMEQGYVNWPSIAKDEEEYDPSKEEFI